MVDLHSMMKVWSPFCMALASNTGQTLLRKKKIYIHICLSQRDKSPVVGDGTRADSRAESRESLSAV